LISLNKIFSDENSYADPAYANIASFLKISERVCLRLENLNEIEIV
jgi:hypothetical protein